MWITNQKRRLNLENEQGQLLSKLGINVVKKENKDTINELLDMKEKLIKQINNSGKAR